MSLTRKELYAWMKAHLPENDFLGTEDGGSWYLGREHLPHNGAILRLATKFASGVDQVNFFVRSGDSYMAAHSTPEMFPEMMIDGQLNGDVYGSYCAGDVVHITRCNETSLCPSWTKEQTDRCEKLMSEMTNSLPSISNENLEVLKEGAKLGYEALTLKLAALHDIEDAILHEANKRHGIRLDQGAVDAIIAHYEGKRLQLEQVVNELCA